MDISITTTMSCAILYRSGWLLLSLWLLLLAAWSDLSLGGVAAETFEQVFQGRDLFDEIQTKLLQVRMTNMRRKIKRTRIKP